MILQSFAAPLVHSNLKKSSNVAKIEENSCLTCLQPISTSTVQCVSNTRVPGTHSTPNFSTSFNFYDEYICPLCYLFFKTDARRRSNAHPGNQKKVKRKEAASRQQ